MDLDKLYDSVIDGTVDISDLSSLSPEDNKRLSYRVNEYIGLTKVDVWTLLLNGDNLELIKVAWDIQRAKGNAPRYLSFIGQSIDEIRDILLDTEDGISWVYLNPNNEEIVFFPTDEEMNIMEYGEEVLFEDIPMDSLEWLLTSDTVIRYINLWYILELVYDEDAETLMLLASDIDKNQEEIEESIPEEIWYVIDKDDVRVERDTLNKWLVERGFEQTEVDWNITWYDIDNFVKSFARPMDMSFEDLKVRIVKQYQLEWYKFVISYHATHKMDVNEWENCLIRCRDGWDARKAYETIYRRRHISAVW